MQRVRQHQSAFGIGIQDFDGLAGHRCDNIARALRIGINHVFDKADNANHIGLRFARSQRVHQAGYSCSAAHVALHVLHAGGWLDRHAAAIEHHALADKSDWLVFRLCRRSNA